MAKLIITVNTPVTGSRYTRDISIPDEDLEDMDEKDMNDFALEYVLSDMIEWNWFLMGDGNNEIELPK